MSNNLKIDEKIKTSQKEIEELKKMDAMLSTSSISSFDSSLPSKITMKFNKFKMSYESASEDKKEKILKDYEDYKNQKLYEIKKRIAYLRAFIHRQENLKEWNSLDDQTKEDRETDLTFYRANISSYWFTLSIILFTLLYLVEMLSMMERTFWVGIFIIVNIALLLFLFTAAIKLKNYVKIFSYLMMVFGVYTMLRTFVIIPFIMGVNIFPTSNDAYLTSKIIVMIVNIYSCIISLYVGITSLRRIKKQEQYMKEGKITFKQMSK